MQVDVKRIKKKCHVYCEILCKSLLRYLSMAIFAPWFKFNTSFANIFCQRVAVNFCFVFKGILWQYFVDICVINYFSSFTYFKLKDHNFANNEILIAVLASPRTFIGMSWDICCFFSRLVFLKINPIFK